MIYSIQEMASSLKAARIQKGISQRALGALINVPQSHISKIEQGKVDLQTSTLIQMARILDLELVLVPRLYLTAVQSLLTPRLSKRQRPAYRLPDEDEEGQNDS